MTHSGHPAVADVLFFLILGRHRRHTNVADFQALANPSFHSLLRLRPRQLGQLSLLVGARLG